MKSASTIESQEKRRITSCPSGPVAGTRGSRGTRCTRPCPCRRRRSGRPTGIPVGLPDRRRLQGHGRVHLVPRLPLVPATGPDGQDVMRRFSWLSIVLALFIAYPLVLSTPFQQRLGALVLLYAIAASAWNVIGGYAGQ